MYFEEDGELTPEQIYDSLFNEPETQKKFGIQITEKTADEKAKETTEAKTEETIESQPPAPHQVQVFDKTLARKTLNNIEQSRILPSFFARGTILAFDYINKKSKFYKEFIKNNNTLVITNPFYTTKLRGYLLVTQHLKVVFAILLKAKETNIDFEGKIIIKTTARAIALQAGLGTSTTYSKEKKEYVIDLLAQLQSASVSIKQNSSDKEITFSIIDLIQRDNDNLIITFSKTFSQQIHTQYMLLLPKNIDFQLPALVFATILYFKSQTANSSNNKIGIKKLLEIIRPDSSDKSTMYKYKQMLEKYTIDLNHNLINFDSERGMLEQIIIEQRNN